MIVPSTPSEACERILHIIGSATVPPSQRADVLAIWEATPPDDRWHIIVAAQRYDDSEVAFQLGSLYQKTLFRRSMERRG